MTSSATLSDAHLWEHYLKVHTMYFRARASFYEAQREYARTKRLIATNEMEVYMLFPHQPPLLTQELRAAILST